ncbi:MAG: hypothetical protein PUD72_02220 [Oscillospiraceae bacterium]|nr:hypothetical protein [Oscillospiraceae bacterium]
MKKLLAVILAIALVGVTPLFASAYDTDLEYSVSVNEEIDVNQDGTIDGIITDETPYLLMVPETLVVDGEKETVYIAGIVDTDISIMVPQNVDMVDDVDNHISAIVELDGGVLTLQHSVTEITYANTDIGSFWETAPITGQWTGNFVYTVS